MRARLLVAVVFVACSPKVKNVNGEIPDVGLVETPADVADVIDDRPSDVVDSDGDAPPIGGDTTSGTRIKARYTVTTSEDGAKSRTFLGWQDTLRGEPCAFSVASDGKARCMPSSVPAIFGYTDAACAAPIASFYAMTGCPGSIAVPKTYAVTLSCATRAFTVGSELTTIPEWYLKTGAGCVKQSTAWPYTTYRNFAAGAEVPATDFAAGTITETLE